MEGTQTKGGRGKKDAGHGFSQQYEQTEGGHHRRSRGDDVMWGSGLLAGLDDGFQR